MDSVSRLATRANECLQSHLDGARLNERELELGPLMAAAGRPGPRDHYKHFTPEAHAIVARLRDRWGDAGVRLALYGAMLAGVRDTLRSDRFHALPPRVRTHQLVHYERIVTHNKPDAEWLSLDQDLFHKDFGLAVLRLYAAEAQLVDPRCGIPRSILFAGGLNGLLKASASMLRLRGFAPYLQIHTHTAYLKSFNEEGWNECYRTCAELYSLHPECLGMFGASWFYDPVIDTVSPRLSYLTRVPLEGGAQRLFFASEGEFVNDAIRTSPTRMQLHKEGRYMPRSFLLAWGRREQMRWAGAGHA